MAILVLLGESDPVVLVLATVTGDEMPNDDGNSKLEVYNQSAGALRVTAVEQRECGYGEKNVHVASTVSIAAGDRVPVGKFNPYRYNNTFRRVEFTYPDGVAGLWVAATHRP